MERLGRGTSGSRVHTGSISQPLARSPVSPCPPQLPHCGASPLSLGALNTRLVLRPKRGEWGSGPCCCPVGAGAWQAATRGEPLVGDRNLSRIGALVW